jgi:hypothetical protein
MVPCKKLDINIYGPKTKNVMCNQSKSTTLKFEMYDSNFTFSFTSKNGKYDVFSLGMIYLGVGTT